jgi:DNA-directed RNA polymerase specialized sigma24 family protein
LSEQKSGYKTNLKSTDFLDPERLYLGSKRHLKVVDLLNCVWSEDEEDLVRLVAHGWSQEEIAIEFNVDARTVRRWLQSIRSHAETP